jgi:hypothetical protein
MAAEENRCRAGMRRAWSGPDGERSRHLQFESSGVAQYNEKGLLPRTLNDGVTVRLFDAHQALGEEPLTPIGARGCWGSEGSIGIEQTFDDVAFDQFSAAP